METEIRAVYRNGQFHLLEPLRLDEGQEVKLTLHLPQDDLDLTLEGLLVAPDGEDDPDFDVDAAMAHIRAAFAGQAPLSETILQEREEGW